MASMSRLYIYTYGCRYVHEYIKRLHGRQPHLCCRGLDRFDRHYRIQERDFRALFVFACTRSGMRGKLSSATANRGFWRSSWTQTRRSELRVRQLKWVERTSPRISRGGFECCVGHVLLCLHIARQPSLSAVCLFGAMMGHHALIRLEVTDREQHRVFPKKKTMPTCDFRKTSLGLHTRAYDGA